ncbi:dephospho-CoA kinase [Hippea sp. KM1]|uniref:dephospho-CoA kinase n=1 Tax=Hippea sp. KM1 TaxID=944481 RepID=UPI00046CE9B6|nr:dephospho-CoA kinase [Hippea sp. KM1]
MKFIGLTGSIATGKSFVGAMFGQLGCYVIDADELAHGVYAKGEKAYFEIIKAFGDGVLDEEGNIDRKKLGRIVLKDREKLRLLEGIVHPQIEKKRKELLDEIEKRDKNAIVIYDVPLLFEKNLASLFDCVIVVWADEDTQLKRLMQRNGLSKEEALKRIRLQMPVDEKKRLADIVIDNSDGIERTKAQVLAVFEKIKNGHIC